MFVMYRYLALLITILVLILIPIPSASDPGVDGVSVNYSIEPSYAYNDVYITAHSAGNAPYKVTIYILV